MRSILITVMLIIVAVTIYVNTMGGSSGTNNIIKAQGQKINQSIQSISP